MKKTIFFLLYLLVAEALPAQNVPYGNNPAVGKYFDVGDAKLYYEIYGKGEPLVMLHGGVYGWIDEFEPFIKRLSEQFQVICIGTRGHGKSEAGTQAFSYAQRATDAYKIIRSITQGSVLVVGFSDGGFSALKLAQQYPQAVKKMVTIGVGYLVPGRKFNYNSRDLLKGDSVFFTKRLALMPEPARWDETLSKLNKMYNGSDMGKTVLEKIKCPVLVLNGDQDDYFTVESATQCARAIPNAQLSIIPGCHHVVFFCNFGAVWEAMRPFLSLKQPD